MLLSAIRQIEQEKREANIEPSFATYLEVVHRLQPANAIDGLVSSLEMEGLVKTGQTINGTYIKTINDENN